MGKNKKKQEKSPAVPGAAQNLSESEAVPDARASASEPDPATPGPGQELPEQVKEPVPAATPPPASRLRRCLPDLIKVSLALAVLSVAAVIWYKPPLTRTDFPYVSYQFQGQTFNDAQLLRPLAMPTRYYIRLPKKLADRYEWFAVDRRREVAALTIAPPHHLLGLDAIKRSDPLGLDLEFRKLDHSEWRVYFLPDAIVFSNAVISVRMDTKSAPPPK